MFSTLNLLYLQHIEAQFQAANIEYLKGNFKKSMDILSSMSETCLNYKYVPIICPKLKFYIKQLLSYRDYGESSYVMINSNMGVIYHAMGKPNLACHHFQVALKEDMSNMQTDSKKGKVF